MTSAVIVRQPASLQTISLQWTINLFDNYSHVLYKLSHFFINWVAIENANIHIDMDSPGTYIQDKIHQHVP